MLAIPIQRTSTRPEQRYHIQVQSAKQHFKAEVLSWLRAGRPLDGAACNMRARCRSDVEGVGLVVVEEQSEELIAITLCYSCTV